MAQRFGVGLEVDAYLFTSSIPTFAAGMVSSMISYVIVPRLVECEKNIIYHRQYMGSILIGVVILGLALMGILNFFVNEIQLKILPSGSFIFQYKNLWLLILLACAVGFFLIMQACVINMLNSVRHYIFSSTLGLLPYCVILILIPTLGDRVGIMAVPIGMLMGLVISFSWGLFTLKRYLFPLPSLKNLLWKELGELIRNSPYTAIAMSCFSSNLVVDAYWAPQSEQGTLATLGYVQRIVVGFGSILVAGPSSALVPPMAGFIRDRNYPEFRRLLLRSLKITGGLAFCVVLPLVFFSPEFINFLFSHAGFRQKESAVLASTLSHMAPAMIPMLVSVISLRSLFCFPNVGRDPAKLSLVWTVLYFSLSYLLYSKGAVGLATGYSIVWLVFSVLVTATVFLRVSREVE
jgi:putative peptidoglycan lipid II flippase